MIIMTHLFNRKTRLQKLQQRYGNLMRTSFECAVKNTSKSFEAKKKANEIFEEIEYLTLKRADK
jgi:hypothetical protein